MADGDRTCPSAPCAPGATLLGVAGRDGRVRPVRTAMRIDDDFVAAASEKGPPEARMRFAAPCREGACQQWTGTRCGVIERVLDRLGPRVQAHAALPPCTIRATCRWFSQRGRIACDACSYVVTDQRQAVPAE